MKLQKKVTPGSTKKGSVLVSPQEVDAVGARYKRLKDDIKASDAAVLEISTWVKRIVQSAERRGKIQALNGNNFIVGVMHKTHRSIDAQKLKDRVSLDVWKKIRRVTVTVDEAALAEAVADGLISAKLVKKCIVEHPASPTIYIRERKGSSENSED